MYALSVVNDASRTGFGRIADVQGRDAAALLRRHDDQDVADRVERAGADAAVRRRRHLFHDRRRGGIGRVDDLDAVVGGADVDVLPLPGDAPDRLGVVAVVRAGDRDRLDVFGRGRAGDVPDVDAAAADRDHVEGVAVAGVRNRVALGLAPGAVGRREAGELLGRGGVRHVVDPELLVAADHQVAVEHGRLVDLVPDLHRRRDDAPSASPPSAG